MAVLRACSPIATALIALLLLPRPVTAVPHNHGHKHMHRHVSSTNDLITLGPKTLARRDTSLNIGDLPRYDPDELKAVAHSCSTGPAELPLNQGVPRPVKITTVPQLDVFPRPESVGGMLTMHNYCGYDLYWSHVNGKKVLSDPEDTKVFETGHLPAGGTETRPLAGDNMKVSKTASGDQPVQLEYTHAGEKLWYNLSLIDCLGRKDAKITADMTHCVGHEAGIQMGQPEFAFQCEAGKWCDDQAYLYGVSRYPLDC